MLVITLAIFACMLVSMASWWIALVCTVVVSLMLPDLKEVKVSDRPFRGLRSCTPR